MKRNIYVASAFLVILISLGFLFLYLISSAFSEPSFTGIIASRVLPFVIIISIVFIVRMLRVIDPTSRKKIIRLYFSFLAIVILFIFSFGTLASDTSVECYVEKLTAYQYASNFCNYYSVETNNAGLCKFGSDDEGLGCHLYFASQLGSIYPCPASNFRCIVAAAIHDNNLGVCESASSSKKDYCYSTFAVKSLDSKLCLKAGRENDSCMAQIADKTHDPSLCKGLEFNYLCQQVINQYKNTVITP